MRTTSLLSLAPLLENAKVVWHRITFSRLTILYFLFSVAHCITQVLFQGQAFQINAAATSLFNAVLINAHAKVPGFAFLQQPASKNGTTSLYWCKDMPSGQVMTACRLLWGTGDAYSSGGNYSTATNFVSPSGVSILPSSAISTPVTTQPAFTPTVFVTVTAQTASPSTLDNSNSGDSSALQNVIGAFRPIIVPVVKRTPSPPHDPYYRDSPNPVGPPTEFVNIFSKRGGGGGGGSSAHHAPKGTVLDATTTADNGTVSTITNLPNAPSKLVLSETCLLALNWPLETLQNTKREDIVFINFHVWVLGMSIVALLNESIPHMLASLVTHVMLTGWSVYQLLQTRSFQNDFKSIILDLCQDQNLLPTYWKDRADAEIPSAAFSGAALLVSAWLSWRLFKTYNWATFKRIGASRTVSRVYKIVLTLSVTLQLSLFFIVVSIALWIDQLCNGAIGLTSTHMTLYRAAYISVLILLVPWIVCGWKAVRKERRMLMHGFLVFNVVLIGGWASMFASITFRWTFEQWRFFSLMSVLAVFLSLVTLVLGIWCRKNFGSDLWKCLDAKERLADDEEFASSSANSFYPSDEKRFSYEKVSFPSPGPVPTFGSAFGSNPPSRNASNQSSVMRQPPAAYVQPDRRISVGSAHSASTIDAGPPIRRSGSAGRAKLQKKWVIE